MAHSALAPQFDQVTCCSVNRERSAGSALALGLAMALALGGTGIGEASGELLNIPQPARTTAAALDAASTIGRRMVLTAER